MSLGVSLPFVKPHLDELFLVVLRHLKWDIFVEKRMREAVAKGQGNDPRDSPLGADAAVPQRRLLSPTRSLAPSQTAAKQANWELSDSKCSM
jgi:hypothetical protein